MIFKEEKIFYSVQGLNFYKFLKEIKKNNIEVFELNYNDYNHFSVGVKIKDKNSFIKIAKNLNYKLEIIKRTKLIDKLNLIKNNLIMTFCVVSICIGLFISSKFVFKIEVFGLENVPLENIITVLNNNGFGAFKRKTQYNLEKIEIILKENINEISLASSVIIGNTLIVNVKEKIS